MNLQNTVTYSPCWNWDGDRIMPETIVPSGRAVIGGRRLSHGANDNAGVRDVTSSGIPRGSRVNEAQSSAHQPSTLNPQPRGAVNRAVKRNRNRFPQDFMFQLTAAEAVILKCQIGTSSSGYGGRRPERAELWKRT